MLEIMDKVEELIEKSRGILNAELTRIENDRKFNEYEVTIESVYCKLCNIQLELQLGTTKMDTLDENELDKLSDQLLNDNKENFTCEIQLLNN